MSTSKIREPRKTKVLFLQMVVIGTVVAGWEIGSQAKFLDPFFFSSPSAIIVELWNLFIGGSIYRHLLTTLEEMLIGLGAGIALGVITGFLLGSYETAARAFDPLIMGTYAIPKIAIAPLFVLWFGLGITSKIIFAMTIVFFLVLFNTYAGVRNVDPILVKAVRAMSGGRLTIVMKVLLPSSIPWVLAATRTSIGRALVGAIVGEFVASDQGLGWMILMAAGLFQTTQLMAVVVVLSIIVIVMDTMLRFAENHLLRWRPTPLAL